jgi:flagellar hook-length control protein FliK
MSIFMTLSLLSLLATPQPPVSGENGGLDTQILEEGAESELSFEDLLTDAGGFEMDTPQQDIPQPEGELLSELVPNLVLAQAKASETLSGDSANDVLRGMTGDLEKDFANLTKLPLDAEQSAELASAIDRFLQRPDAGVVLTAAQRNVLFSMAAKLKQAAATGATQPVQQALATLNTQLPANGTKAPERAALMGQVMKWIGQVLRGGETQTAQIPPGLTKQSTKDDAPGRGVALLNVPFPVSSVDEAAAENAAAAGEIDTMPPEQALYAGAAYPAVYVSKLPEPALEIGAAGDTVVEVPQAALAVDLPEVALPGEEIEPEAEDVDGDPELLQALMRMASKSKAPNSHPSSADFAQLKFQPAPDGTGSLPTPFSPTPDAAQAANLAPAAGVAVADSAVSQDIASAFKVEGLNIASVAPTAPQTTVPQPHSTNAPPPSAYTPHTTRSDLLEQVHVGIKQAAFEGVDRITIQLQPMELGRVDVQIEVGHEGRTHISFAADKPETLDQLQRDARILERALQEAGVKADAGSMEFNLRQGQGQAALQGDSQFGQQQGRTEAELAAAAIAEKEAASQDGTTLAYNLTLDQGLDIRV